jgi:transposase InsO family protein
MLGDRLGYFERRVCRAIGQARSSQRYQKAIPHDERRLVAQTHRLALQWPRFGYRRITVLLLRKDGWRVNVKRVHRLWKAVRLQIRKKARKRRRNGTGQNACHRRRPLQKDHVWSYDFVSDRTEGGGRLRLLTVVDEYTRECLAIEVTRHFTGRRVVEVLDELLAIRGRPEYLRSDNGPEFASKAVKKWLNRQQVGPTSRSDPRFRRTQKDDKWITSVIRTYLGEITPDQCCCNSNPPHRQWTRLGWGVYNTGHAWCGDVSTRGVSHYNSRRTSFFSSHIPAGQNTRDKANKFI